MILLHFTCAKKNTNHAKFIKYIYTYTLHIFLEDYNLPKSLKYWKFFRGLVRDILGNIL